MKTLFIKKIILASLFVFPFSAWATSPLVTPVNEVITEILIPLKDVKLKRVLPGEWTAVQPYGTISFKYSSSCAPQEFKVETNASDLENVALPGGRVLEIKVLALISNLPTCGSIVEGTYTLQYSSDDTYFGGIRILNPIEPETVRAGKK